MKKWPLYSALLLYILMTVFFIVTSTSRCDGKLIYALDDAYIHLALADTFSETGTWGFYEGVFSSSSSSLLWTIILSILLKFTRSEVILFILNFIAGISLILLLYNIAKEKNMDSFKTAIMLAMSIVFTSLVALTMLGMEHVLHCFVFILFLHIGSKNLTGEKPFWQILALAPLMGSIRYEGLFTIIAFSMLLLFHRQWLKAFAIIVLGFTPVIIMGFVSHANGWPVVPTSIIAKTALVNQSTIRQISKLLVNFIYQTLTHPLIWPAFILGGFALYSSLRKKDFKSYDFNISALFMLSFFAHLHTAGIGWLYRYEAYLICGSIFVFFITLHRDFKKNLLLFTRKTVLILVTGLCVTAMLLMLRSTDNYWDIYKAQPNIYMQQYQTGRFLKKYYNGSTVILNDIGAPAWLADIHIIDGAGLASKEFTRISWKDTSNYSAEMRRVADSLDADIAIFYANNRNTLKWKRCGSLKIPNNSICASESLLFLAIKPEAEEQLRKNFREFIPELPKTVKVRY